MKIKKIEQGFIYAVEVAELAAIKIGFTKRPIRRMSKIRSSLRVAHARKNFKIKVLLLVRGTNVDEQSAHEAMTPYSLEMPAGVTGKSEWYKDVPAVRAWVAAYPA